MPQSWNNCPNLAAFWSNSISLIVYIYSLYSACNRYSHWRTNISDPRYGFQWNYLYLFIYLYCIIVSCILWIIMLYSSIFKTGHLANDFVNLASENLILDYDIRSKKCGKLFKRFKSRLKYHLKPFASLIHLLGSYLLLVPLNLMIAEDYKHDIINNVTGFTQTLSHLFPEILNFILASVIYTVRAPTIFLSSYRPISILISCYIFISFTSVTFNILWNFHLSYLQYSSVQSNYWLSIVLICQPIKFFCIVLNTCLLHECCRGTYLKQILSHTYYSSSCDKYPAFGTSIFLLVVYLILAAFSHISIPTNQIWWLEVGCIILHIIMWLITCLLVSFKSTWPHLEMPGLIMNESGHGRLNLLHSFKSSSTSAKMAQQDTIYTCFHPNDSLTMMTRPTPGPVVSSAPPSSSVSGGSTSTDESRSRLSHEHNNCLQTLSLDLLDASNAPIGNNYEDIKYHPHNNRVMILNNISEEQQQQQNQQSYSTMRYSQQASPATITDYFKSPNVSMRSSNIHSSDSGIGCGAVSKDGYISSSRSTEFMMNSQLPNLCSTDAVGVFSVGEVDEDLSSALAVAGSNTMFSDV